MQDIRPESKIRIGRKFGIVIIFFFLTAIFIFVLPSQNRETQNRNFLRKERLKNDIWCEEWEDGIIYCRWFRCKEDTADFFIKFIKKTPRHRGTIVDLRGNTGGLLQEGIALAGLWYDEGAPLLTLYRDENDSPVASIKCLSQKELQNPVVAIIDGNTMSTAEVVAGLIGFLPNGCLVGQKTFGDPIARVDIIAGNPPRSMEMKLIIKLQDCEVHHKGIEPDFYIQPGEKFTRQGIEHSLLILKTFQGIKQ